VKNSFKNNDCGMFLRPNYSLCDTAMDHGKPSSGMSSAFWVR